MTHSKALPDWSLRPKDTWIGIAMSFTLLGLWSGLLIASLFFIPWQSLWFLLPPVILLQTFLYTGVFITAHDAMHGIVCHRHPRLNNMIGIVCVIAYAMFSFSKLLAQHKDHHQYPGTTQDPDFHAPNHPSFFRWYLHFLLHYISLTQIVFMAIIFNLLLHGLHVAHWKLLVVWVLPSLLSTFQLFYFGTFLPHRSESTPFDDEHNARSNQYPVWLSLVTCYHFGYHWEHHTYPHCPWWRLPALRRRLEQTKITKTN